MARYHGMVGYGEAVENPAGSGVWVDQIREFPYTGDVVRNTVQRDQGEKVNSDISVGNSISVVADAYANENFSKIKYVQWNGELWTVTSVEVRSPRLILSLGRVYSGPTPESADNPG